MYALASESTHRHHFTEILEVHEDVAYPRKCSPGGLVKPPKRCVLLGIKHCANGDLLSHFLDSGGFAHTKAKVPEAAAAEVATPAFARAWAPARTSSASS